MLEKFINKNLNLICEICKGSHKTSRHSEYEEYEIEKKENSADINIICDVCGGLHKTLRHSEYAIEKKGNSAEDRI